MKMTELANLLMMTAETLGDREVAFVEEGTGEVRYVEGLSFDQGSEYVHLEHLGYDDMTLVAQINEIEKELGELGTEELAKAVLENLMKEVFG